MSHVKLFILPDSAVLVGAKLPDDFMYVRIWVLLCALYVTCVSQVPVSSLRNGTVVLSSQEIVKFPRGGARGKPKSIRVPVHAGSCQTHRRPRPHEWKIMRGRRRLTLSCSAVEKLSVQKSQFYLQSMKEPSEK